MIASKLFIPMLRYHSRRLNNVKSCGNSVHRSYQANRMKKKLEWQDARPYDEIPGPKALPIFGNSMKFIPYISKYGNLSMSEQMKMLRNDYGDIVKLDGIFGKRPAIFLFDPEQCEKMYRVEGIWPMRIAIETMKCYRERNAEAFKGQMGLVSSQGQLWHDFRKNVNQHMMQPKSIKPHVVQVDGVTNEFIRRLREIRDVKTSKLPSSFNNEMNKWALESICMIALDHRIGCFNADLQANSESQIMINSVHQMFELFYKLEILPSLWRLYETHNLKKLFKTLDTINRIAGKHIDEAKIRFAMNQKSEGDNRSVLESLLSINHQTAHIMAVDMLTAGIDTTANAAGTLLYYISINSRVQNALRAEISNLLPEKTTPITFEILNNIPYVKACIKESLRLTPIAIGNLRTLPANSVLSGYEIPKGTDVIACHSVLAVDPKYFSQPTDFIPERWLKNNTLVRPAKNAHPFAYMPFGFGPRTCIGRRFAEMEIEILVLRMLQNFYLEWPHNESLKFKSKFINTIGSPLELKIIDV